MNDQPDTNNDNNNNNDQPPVAPNEPVNTAPQPHQHAAPQPQPYQPAPPAPQGYPAQPGMAYAPPMENPGQTLGIIGLILNFFGIAIGGIILGVMSRNKSKAVGMSTALGTISLVWGIIATVLVSLVIIFWIILVAAAVSNPEVMNPLESSGGSSSHEFN